MVSTQENTSADKKAPLLSIGMIFKNEERCLEQCLQALAPLRKAIDCELVMADTGSTDSSREIAAKYADILFDFPWVNDFSAARNAVMDRCSGKWFLSIDADEYFDPDFNELLVFFSNPIFKEYDFATVVVRNYHTFEIPSDSYDDFYALRLMRMATKQRYQGRIHESWQTEDTTRVIALSQVILHHDGYVNEETSHQKSIRNLPLLEEELAEQPENMRLAMLLINASHTSEQIQKYGNLIISLMEKRVSEWKAFGPPALRTAISQAVSKNLPELKNWFADAEKYLTFPTPFYSVDIMFFKTVYHHACGELSASLEAAEKYQNGLVQWHKEKDASMVHTLSPIGCDTPLVQRRVYMITADCYAKLGQWEEGFAALHKASCFQESLDAADHSILTNLLHFRKNSHADMTSLLQIIDRFPISGELKELVSFLLTETPAQAEALLSSVSDWERISPFIPEHALQLGIYFPDSFYTRSAEAMQESIKQLLALSGKQPENLLALCRNTPVSRTTAQAAWYYHLAAAVIQAFASADQDFSKIHAVFLKQTETYLHTFYQPEILTEAYIHLLPQNVRFSWYILRAQILLESGAVADCVRCLRAGLQIAPHMKPLIQYLLEQVNKPPKQEPVSSELMMLAEKIRSVLSAFPPDDPSVLALKASPVYQQVAHLIENNT